MNIDQAFDEFIEFPEGSSGNLVTTVSAKLFAKYCVEKLQEENERLLFANRYSADMYRQIDDERKRLQEEVERLQDQVVRLLKQNTKVEVLARSLEQDRDQLKGVLQDVNTSDYRFSVEQLAAHDAEVIERAIEHFRKGYINRSIHWQELQEYANQLRQQAKEVQS